MAEETGYEEIGFDDESISTERVEKYKGRKNYTDRIGFVFPKRIKKVKVHYKDKYITCNGGLCCDKMGPSQWRLGTTIVQYRTDKNGKLEKPFGYTIKHLIFSGKKFEELRFVDGDNHNFLTKDLKILCVEEGYQQLKYSVCDDSVWQKDDRLKAQIMKEAEEAHKHIYLSSNISNDDLREMFGMEAQGTSTVEPTDDNQFDDMLKNMDLES